LKGNPCAIRDVGQWSDFAAIHRERIPMIFAGAEIAPAGIPRLQKGEIKQGFD
jgi:hypothetical protein